MGVKRFVMVASESVAGSGIVVLADRLAGNIEENRLAPQAGEQGYVYIFGLLAGVMLPRIAGVMNPRNNLVNICF